MKIMTILKTMLQSIAVPAGSLVIYAREQAGIALLGAPHRRTWNVTLRTTIRTTIHEPRTPAQRLLINAPQRLIPT
jgi:hypothetical protein